MKSIDVLITYHNNLMDSLRAMQKILNVKILTVRADRVPKDIMSSEIKDSKIGILKGMNSPTKIWKIKSDYLLVKHINEPKNFFPYLICWIRGIRCVIMVQKIIHLKSPVYRFFFRLLIRFLRHNKVRIISVTEEGYIEARKYFNDVVYAPACIEPKRYSVKHYVDSGKLQILTVSKYDKRKNIPLLLESVEKLARKHPNIEFELTVVGALFGNRMKEYRYIEKLAAKVSYKVKLLKNVKYEEIGKYYINSDLFILPATREPLGYVVAEAMASGLPILCSEDIGAKSYVKEGKNGYIFETEDCHAIVSSVENFIMRKINWQKLNKFGKMSRRIIEKEHSPSAFIDKLEMVL